MVQCRDLVQWLEQQKKPSGQVRGTGIESFGGQFKDFKCLLPLVIEVASYLQRVTPEVFEGCEETDGEGRSVGVDGR